MSKEIVFFSALALFGSLCLAQQAKVPVPEKGPAEVKVPPEYVKMENPEKPTPGSLARAKKLFGYDCAMCHGKEGDGKGDLAEQLKLKLRDYRDPEMLKGRTDGEMFYVILKGKAEMVGSEGRLKPPEIWGLVNYIRSITRKAATEKPKEEKPPAEKPPT